jgi:hypothetical protein
MSSDPGRDVEREQALRRMLTDAVEPIEPAPGAQTRLLARARAHRRRKERPLVVRWAPAALASLLVILGVTLLFAVRGGNRSNGSSGSSSAAGAPSPAAGSTAVQPAEPESAAAPVPGLKQLSSKAAASDQSAGAAGTHDSFNPNQRVPGAASVSGSDLDGDGRPDTFTLRAATLAAQLSRVGLEAVSLPPLGPGARVLGVTALTDSNGAAVPVVFVRLRQAGAKATDTVVALVDGRLTVLRQGSGPVLLKIDATHGYGCSQGTLAVSGNAAPFRVGGSSLVPSAVVRAAAATPAKTFGCF